MKKLLSICLSLALLSGCSLLPKKVEYGQKKVKPVPEAPKVMVEHQRQAAQYVAVKTEEVKVAALKENSSTNILVPAAEAHGAAEALTESLGPAEKPFIGPMPELVQTLHKDQAKLNEKIETYREKVEPEVGKKIEGTGFLQLGYFTNMALVIVGPILLIALLWGGLKIYGSINPAVGAGVNVVGRVASSVLSKGMAEVVAGGERFKSYLETSKLPADAKALVSDLFSRAHQEAQSQDVQAVVTSLTKQVASSTPSTVPVTPALGSGNIPATAAIPTAQVNISTPAGAGGSQTTVSTGSVQVTVSQTAQPASAVGPSTSPEAPPAVVTPPASI
jgi:hypothetical protein